MSTAPLRQELEDLIRRDLLGPAGGEQEISPSRASATATCWACSPR